VAALRAARVEREIEGDQRRAGVAEPLQQRAEIDERAAEAAHVADHERVRVAAGDAAQRVAQAGPLEHPRALLVAHDLQQLPVALLAGPLDGRERALVVVPVPGRHRDVADHLRPCGPLDVSVAHPHGAWIPPAQAGDQPRLCFRTGPAAEKEAGAEPHSAPALWPSASVRPGRRPRGRRGGTDRF
jgi:hypothetical protein